MKLQNLFFVAALFCTQVTFSVDLDDATKKHLAGVYEDEFTKLLKPGVVGQKNPAGRQQIENEIKKRAPKAVKQVEDEDTPKTELDSRIRAYAQADVLDLLKKKAKADVDKVYDHEVTSNNNFPISNINRPWSWDAKKDVREMLRHKQYALVVGKKTLENYFIDPQSECKNAIHQFYGLNKKPAKPKEINELYPDFKQNSRNIEYYAQKLFTKFREDTCPICLEEFLDLKNGRRVNLFCGHSICPTCLATNMYIAGSTACPVCRKEISKEEFSTTYLAPHIDFNKILEDHPGYKDIVCKLFGYCR
jgi:hypothetical protein